MSTTQVMKRCAGCLRELPLTAFHVRHDKKKPNATHQPRCKDCRRKPGALVLYRDIASRFWQYVDQVPGGCWIYHGTIASNGYGAFRFNYKHYAAHRLSYTLTYGPIPEGLVICHRCDVKVCVRPDHLFVGTLQENTMDSILKGRWHQKKLTAADVQDILLWHAKGVSQKTLCAEYNVSSPTMSGIITGKYWKHIKRQ